MRFPSARRTAAGAIILACVGVASVGVSAERRPASLELKVSAGPEAAGSKAGSADANCTRFAAHWGRDSWPGSRRRPFRAAARLAAALQHGDVGCLRGGTYSEEEVSLTSPDTTLTSYLGERAELVGRLKVTADGVSVERLKLDGRNPESLPSPTINADDVRFRYNDVSSPGSGICFLMGSMTEVERPVIERNRIHDCGDSTLYDHGIYMQDVNDARIRSNLIYDNASRGIKVGPDSQRALISGNVIDGNPIGLNFSGNSAGTTASSHNVVEHNVIANSTRWYNVQYYWPDDSAGEGNEVRFNCLHGGNSNPYYNSDGGVSDEVGFSAHDNVVAKPEYKVREDRNFSSSEHISCEQGNR